MTNYPIGTHVFYVPIRYWETQEPEEYIITKELGEKDRCTHVYVKNLESTWSGYLCQEDVFLKKENAAKTAFLKWLLDETRRSDEVAFMMLRISDQHD